VTAVTAAGGGDPGWGLQDVHVRFGRRAALAGVTLDAPRSAVTALVGGDGSGKTTALRALVGALVPTAGRARHPAQRDIGYLPASGGVYPDLTVDENLAFVGAAFGVHGHELARRAGPLLEHTGLATARDRLAGKLSGGMRQKLALAMTLLHQPGLLVLDEPTTGVDPFSRAELWRLIAGAAAAGAAVVLATSYLDEAERATSVLVLDRGRVLAGGTPDQVIAAVPGTVAAASQQPPPPAASWRRGAGWRVWSPDGSLPPGADPAQIDLEDAVTVAALRAERDQPAAGAERDQPAAGLAPAPATRTRPAHPAGRQAQPLAEARDARRRFGTVTAVDGVTVRVRPGEVVGLLGANGAGKTTLILMLLGLLPPSGGQVRLFGQPPSLATRRRLGYVPQRLGLYDDLTVDENLAFAAAAFDIHPPRLDADLDRERHQLVRDLPLGLQRRAAFAQALAHRPDLLVLDEPTSGVDPLGRARLWDSIRQAAEDGAGALVTTHNMEEAEQCDRLVVMVAGRVAADGTMAGIVGGAHAVEVRARRWEDAFTALDTAGMAVALVGRALRLPSASTAQVRDQLAAAGVDAAVREVPATFEEAFVTLSAEAA
jgi:ABC-2 type transport system ATP-binding protein